MNRALVSVAAAVLIGGCGGSSPAPAPTREAKATTTPARLKPGKRCPITRRHFINQQFGYAAGDGKVAYIGLPRGPVTRIAPPYARDSGFRHSAWGGQKALWLLRDIEGVVEIRGHRLDAPGDVRFGQDEEPAEVLRLGWLDGSSAWQSGTGMVRLQGPGCYAYDISAPGVHETIVFRAVIWDVH
jgi:hypothetical protein